MTNKRIYKHREQWLAEALALVREHFTEAGYTVPDAVRVGVGWPSKQAFGKTRRIGEAWSNECSADKTHEIIISIYLSDPIKILGVLIHEVIHVTVGVDKGHRRPFTKAMKAVGLCGKPTATGETPELVETLKQWVEVLGVYPHAQLDGKTRKKDTTRMLKLECVCGLKIRTTQKWMDTYSPPWPCPCGGTLEDRTDDDDK